MCGFKICLLSEWCESVSQSNTFLFHPQLFVPFNCFVVGGESIIRYLFWINVFVQVNYKCVLSLFAHGDRGNLQTETRRGGVNFWDINLINLCPWELPLQIQWFEVLLVIRLRLIADCLNSALNWLPHSLEKWMVIITTSFTWSYQHLKTSIDE